MNSPVIFAGALTIFAGALSLVTGSARVGAPREDGCGKGFPLHAGGSLQARIKVGVGPRRCTTVGPAFSPVVLYVMLNYLPLHELEPLNEAPRIC